ncbi:MAG: substrate-binding domain-containing protein [bacterium]
MTDRSHITGAIHRRTLLKGAAATGLVAVTGFPFIRGARAAGPLTGKKLGFSMTHSTNEWLVQMRSGVVETAKRLGTEAIVYDAKDSPAKQITDIEDLVTRRVDVILISTFYADAISAGVKTANEAGIPLIVLSSTLQADVDWTCHLSTDTPGTAREAGEYYVKRLGGEGKVVQIEGKPGSVVNQARGEGWREVIEQQPGIEIVGHVIANYSQSEALQAMEDVLQANPQIDAVYCHNDGMALGAIQAAKENDRAKEMFFTGYDGMRDDALKAIYEGDLEATWEYLPFGVEAVEIAAKIVQGESVPKSIQFPSPLITRENVLEWYDPDTGSRKSGRSALSAIEL